MILLEVVWLSVIGISLSVPPDAVLSVVSQSLNQLRQHAITADVQQRVAPALNRSMVNLIHTVNIQVDGIPLGINPANERHLQQQLMQDMNRSMLHYFNHQIESPGLAKNLTGIILAHPHELRVRASFGPLSIPVRISIP